MIKPAMLIAMSSMFDNTQYQTKEEEELIGVVIPEEYKLIKQKKSRLPVRLRELVVWKYEEHLTNRGRS